MEGSERDRQKRELVSKKSKRERGNEIEGRKTVRRERERGERRKERG